MGTCTSTARQRRHRQQQPYKQSPIKNLDSLDIQPLPSLPPFPLSVCSHHHLPLSPPPSYDDFDVLSSSSSPTRPIYHQADTNSLIQLYSHNNTNNNNNNSTIITWMSSGPPPRIPVPRNRLPIYQSQIRPPTSTTQRPKQQSDSTVIVNSHAGFIRPMSIYNRAPPPPTTMQPRFGFIPRPTAPTTHLTIVSNRSRSISPTSTTSVKSSSSSLASQRLAKARTASKTASNQSAASSTTTDGHATKPKTLYSPYPKQPSATNTKSTTRAPTTASLNRSRTPLRTTLPSPSTAVAPSQPSSNIPTTTTTAAAAPDMTAMRDRFKNQKRMNFFTRRTPLSNGNGSPLGSPVVNETKKDPSIPGNPITTNNQIDDSKSLSAHQVSGPQGDSAYASVTVPSNRPSSAHLSQGNRHRQRAISMLSSSSALSDVLNQDALLEDDNCSLKSDDMMCDFDDTLTIDSVSKNDRTDSCSSASISIDVKKPITTTKPTVPLFQPASRERRAATIAKCSTAVGDKNGGSLLESLDELSKLSQRNDGDANRKITRSVSMKPPTTTLPPLDDAELIGMDIESYRQVMKDVMVVKTILHQLDRLLKHSDGADMTDSMIGSFHEFHDSMIGSRRYSTSNDPGRGSFDENLSYDDLLKEIVTLRKEKEQDKQTIKLLQEQMYKYSSQTNG